MYFSVFTYPWFIQENAEIALQVLAIPGSHRQSHRKFHFSLQCLP